MRFTKSRPTGVALLALFLCWTTVVNASNGFDVSRMDTSIQPCQNFYLYANGNWLKQNPVPPAYALWGSFNILDDRNRNIVHDLLKSAAQKMGAPKGSAEQLIGDYYSACMDEARIEAAGVKPLEKDFAEIEKVKDVKDVQKLIGMLHAKGVSGVFGFGPSPDLRNSSQIIGGLRQGGLSLPNKDYYTKDDAKSKETREKFVQHITNMFKLLGDDEAKASANAQTVMAIQMRLANASKSLVELRNPEANYNKIKVTELQAMTPDFDWTAYLAERKAPTFSEINVGQPDFFREVNKMLTQVSVADWKTYFRWQLVNSAAGLLPSKFADENFDFYSRYLAGQKEQQPRWRRCSAATDGALGDAVGQAYVKKAFPPEAKAHMNKLIDNLFAAYKERLQKLDWMSETTKQQALTKLSTIKRKVGYPDKWRDYKEFSINRASYIQNVRNTASAEITRNLNKIGKPVDKTEWGMTPPTVNAYYNALFNEIAFPAGILQPPFFDPEADDAINYGAIGAVIGHEITHGFDDQGSKFDAEGNLKNWWTPEDRKKFEEKTQCVIDQFNGFKVAEGLFQNGKLVLGEATADLGGLMISYDAFQKSMQGVKPAKIDGFTPEQRFFLGFAQVWATNARPEQERVQTLGAPHPLPRFRANGTLSNIPVFAEAFSCKAGDPMVKDNGCKVW